MSTSFCGYSFPLVIYRGGRERAGGEGVLGVTRRNYRDLQTENTNNKLMMDPRKATARISLVDERPGSGMPICGCVGPPAAIYGPIAGP